MTSADLRVVAIVQARMGSTRLPGKVLAPVAGRPMLHQQLLRLDSARTLDEIVIATTDDPQDDRIQELASGLGFVTVRGSRDDVLGRFRSAAQERSADVVVRITADCPLIDPEITDRVVEALTDNRASADYASNVLARTYPQGLDVESFFFDTLLRMDRIAMLPDDREHVTTVLRGRHRPLFRTVSVTDDENNADLRWTVDEEADLRLVRCLFDELDLGGRLLGYREILAHVRSHPELAAINSEVESRMEAAKTAGAPQ